MQEAENMSSYYGRPWKGHVEVSLYRQEWVRASGDLGSVEAGLEFVGRHVFNGYWRIVDEGGNSYEQGDAREGYLTRGDHIIEFKTDPIPAEVAARQLAFYKEFIGAPVHIAEAERRRLLEETLKEEEDAA